MLIHDDIYAWEGWGGKLKLASGCCRLRIFDLKRGSRGGLAHLRPIIAIVSDVPESGMSVKSCTSHIATNVVRDFQIDPDRMVWVEYDPGRTYGPGGDRIIPDKYERVDFVWHDGKAIQPKWRHLKPDMEAIVAELIAETDATD